MTYKKGIEKMRLIVGFVGFCLLVNVSSLWAYGVDTHVTITARAVEKSVMKDDAFYENLGVETRLNYFPSAGLGLLDAKQLVAIGADLEDEEVGGLPNRVVPFAVVLTPMGIPFMDVASAWRNHFYDPQGDRMVDPLDLGINVNGNKSYDWVLKSDEERSGQHEKNDYSVDALYFSYLNVISAEMEDNREESAAFLLEGIGRLVHHIQDMAQPQHTRNDMHCDTNFCVGINSKIQMWDEFKHVEFEPTLYETYAGELNGDRALPFGDGSYPIVHLGKFEEYWVNSQAKSGMSHISSYNFVSSGTNFRSLKDDADVNDPAETIMHPKYPLPRLSDTVYSPKNIGSLVNENPNAFPYGFLCLGCEVDFIGNSFIDRTEGAEGSNQNVVNDRLTTRSIFTPDLDHTVFNRTKQALKGFSLNRFNMESAYEILLPRAVGYSAGMIDYFFRGQLELKDQIVNGSTTTFEITNKSKTGDLEFSLGEGVFEIYYDDSNDVRHGITTADISGGEVSSEIGFDEIISLEASMPSDMDASKPIYIVFKGEIGTAEAAEKEYGVAVLKVSPESSGLFATVPGSGAKSLQYVDGAWATTDTPGLVAGNIDWKGQYKSGVPTNILSWKGPRARYFGGDFEVDGESVVYPYSKVIYQGGAAFTTAPHDVLGAAIQLDVNGNEWIIAATHNANEDVIYIRPNTRNLSPGIYSADSNPEGWKEIGRHPIEAKHARWLPTPWFFNGEGVKAQTMRFGLGIIDSEEADVMDRFQLNVSLNSSAVLNFGYESGTSSLLAVDYLDDKLIKLEVSHTDFMTIDGAEILPKTQTGTRCHTGQELYCGGQSAARGISIGKNGLYYLDHYGLVLGRPVGYVYIHVYDFDLRSNVIGYSHAINLYREDKTITRSLYVSDNGIHSLLSEWTLAALPADEFYLKMDIMSSGVKDIIGYYRFYGEDKRLHRKDGYVPLPSGSLASDSRGNVLASYLLPNGNNAHYISNGNVGSVFGINELTDSLLPIGVR